METAFGADFSEVRIQDDGTARESGAVALTRGTQISVDAGSFDPHSAEGLEVLAHELTHVVQQRDGRVPGSGITDDPALEAEADEAGLWAASGRSVDVGTAAAPAGAPATAAVAQPMWPFGKNRQPPPENYRQTIYQDLPSRAMAEFQEAHRQRKSPYQNIPTIEQLQAIHESPYQNIPEAFPPPVPTAPKPPVRPRPRGRLPG
jgi:hypothetical protein